MLASGQLDRRQGSFTTVIPSKQSQSATPSDYFVPFGTFPHCASKACADSVLSAAVPSCSTKYTLCFSSSTTAQPSFASSAAATASGSGPAGNAADSNCRSIPRSCFCALPDPLRCVWQASPGNEWTDPCRLQAEDWLDSVCNSQSSKSKNQTPGQAQPDAFAVQKLSFDGSDKTVPKCLRKCLQESVFNRGCFTYKRNCFCSSQHLFDCQGKCKTKEKGEVIEWYSGVCLLSKDTAAAVVNARVEVQPSRHIHIAWYEGLAIAVLGLSIIVIVVHVVWFRNNRLKKLQEKKET
jgi:hypothetical protein